MIHPIAAHRPMSLSHFSPASLRIFMIVLRSKFVMRSVLRMELPSNFRHYQAAGGTSRVAGAPGAGIGNFARGSGETDSAVPTGAR